MGYQSQIGILIKTLHAVLLANSPSRVVVCGEHGRILRVYPSLNRSDADGCVNSKVDYSVLNFIEYGPKCI